MVYGNSTLHSFGPARLSTLYVLSKTDPPRAPPRRKLEQTAQSNRSILDSPRSLCVAGQVCPPGIPPILISSLVSHFIWLLLLLIVDRFGRLSREQEWWRTRKSTAPETATQRLFNDERREIRSTRQVLSLTPNLTVSDVCDDMGFPFFYDTITEICTCSPPSAIIGVIVSWNGSAIEQNNNCNFLAMSCFFIKS